MSRKGLWRILAVLALAMLVLAGCDSSKILPSDALNVLDPKGTAGEKSLDLIYFSIAIMLVVFAIVMAIFIYVLVKFRKREGVTLDRSKYKDHNTVLEIIWTVLPIAALVALAIPTVKYTFDLAEVPKGDDVLVVEVVGHQYWWEFKYPKQGFKTAQELHIPVGKKVHFKITGTDVLHAFWVPALGGKMDVIPGRVNELTLDAKKAGLYHGKCAELCGASHALMDFKVVAEEQADFDKWLAKMSAPPAPVVTAKEKQGEEIFNSSCIKCHAGMDPKRQGPDLTKFGNRQSIAGVLKYDEKNLKAWLKDPKSIKPGTKMEKFDFLNDQELDALTQYLMNRK
ncbi:cytochrome c oxidase subunit 2 [Croceifilum oryzae]|uniref:Cytochrome c oxidase subunit 2 n=1 Tax=Croceifilum oryzae TaxID=1553429 RepID=A0AAJ1THX3_9BACL|nr:cytochrome c oxidase subunit II [Croceifilum oryzae]MDQ0418824.1 cytochrome c oxidase subunit 2 [Croceifilum oryzae]